MASKTAATRVMRTHEDCSEYNALADQTGRGEGGGTKECVSASPDPSSFIFIQFSARNLQNNRLAHPLWELAPPPKENPGSATAIDAKSALHN